MERVKNAPSGFLNTAQATTPLKTFNDSKKTTAGTFSRGRFRGVGSVQSSLSPIARPATPKMLSLSISLDHGTLGCCRCGVGFSIFRAPSPLISPDGDSALPTGACPIDGDPGVTP